MNPEDHPMVVAYGYARGIGTNFVTENGEIEVQNCNDLLETLLPQCNGYNTTEKLISMFRDFYTEYSLRKLLDALEEHGILVDSRRMYEHFHPFSKNPMTYAHRRTREELESMLLHPERRQCSSAAGFDIEPSSTPLGVLLQSRQSTRAFAPPGVALTKEVVSGLVWSTCGATNQAFRNIFGLRHFTIPSAGYLRSVEQYLIILGAVEGLDSGLYYFDKEQNRCCLQQAGGLYTPLHHAMNDSAHLLDGAYILQVLTSRVRSMAGKYANRAYRYALLEAGHAAQNAYLYCTEQGLGIVEYGGFLDDEVSKILNLNQDDEIPLITLIVGRKK